MKSILTYIRSLRQKKARAEKKAFIMEGIRAVEELCKSPEQRFKVIYTQELESTRRGQLLLQNLTRRQIDLTQVTPQELAAVSDCETPAGILAVAEIKEYRLTELLDGPKPFLVVLGGIQDPGNLGAIIRTAEAAGVTGIILSKETVDPYNPKVVRATMGSLLRLPLVKVDNLLSLIKKLRARQIKTVACDAHGAKNYYETGWRLPLALIFGNEGAGMTKEITVQMDEVIKIPQRQGVDSLNVAVAAGIIMYQVVEKGRNRI
ncbi:MAG: 23S rRNA (guanosine(2251)-2'-O)-methyltransferase RlmB [Elusimicrobia bacterium]|nr:23S rRNA (guanosine(2251)-2'-O)-methyltransferase RlmB [Elusimicrobiota bacterium]